MATAKQQAQIGMEDRMVDDADLLDLLEHRQKAKEARDRADVTFKGWDDKAGAKVEGLDLGDGVYRCGAYVITLGRTKSHLVDAFTTKAGNRTVKIRPVKAED